MKRTIYITIPIVFTACGLWAQPAEFEVASIKPTTPPDMSGGKMMIRMGCTADPGRVNCSGLTVKDMLGRAYGLKPYQINGPSWIESERWDVTAKIPEGAPAEKLPEMWQTLLNSRMHLVTRKETKELNIYALVVGKNGPKLTPAEDKATPITLTAPDGSKVSVGAPGPGPAGGGQARQGAMVMDGSGKMQVRGATLGGLSDMLSRMMDRPVIDMTNVDGRYDITLEISVEDMVGMKRMAGGGGGAMMMMHGAGGDSGGPAPDSAPKPSVFNAISQLGLKLEPRKSPLEALVVEKADRPSEN